MHKILHKILFVCLGNICRSPAALAIFKKKASEILPHGTYEVDSRAIAKGSLGLPPFFKMVEACKKKGYEVDTSRASTLITSDDFEKYEYILVADHSIFEKLLTQTPDVYKKRIQLMTAFSAKYKDQDIPDPFYKDEAAFDYAIAVIEDSMESLIKHIHKGL